MSSVMVLGSLNADLVVRAARLPGNGETVTGHSVDRVAGGKGLNQAIAAARAGASVRMIGCVGNDDHGAYLVGVAQGDGIEDSIERVDDATGVALIEVSDDATNRIIVVPGANAHAEAELVKRHLASVEPGPHPDVVLCQLETPLDGVVAALEWARRVGALTVLNPAPWQDLPRQVLGLVDWLILNEHEAALLLGEAELASSDSAAALQAAHGVRSRGAAGVVITLGRYGAVAVGPDGAERVVGAFAVKAVDSTAAGDSFCGAFCATLGSGSATLGRQAREAAILDRALLRAAASGALAVTRAGAVPSIPHAEQVDQLLAAEGAKG